jgi:hypothetical protein
MSLRWCESPGNAARIAALSADQAPTAIIGCPHMESGYSLKPPDMTLVRQEQTFEHASARYDKHAENCHAALKLI